MIKITQDSLNKCLHQAISLGDVGKVHFWLKKGADPRATHDELGFNPLAHSVSKGSFGLDCTKALLDNTEFSNDELTNALGYGPGSINSFPQIELLLSKGASPDAVNRYGVYAVHDCIGNRKFEELKLLVTKEADLNVKHLHYNNVIEHLSDKEDALDILIWFDETCNIGILDTLPSEGGSTTNKTHNDTIQNNEIAGILQQAMTPLRLECECRDDLARSPSPNDLQSPEAYCFVSVMGGASTECQS